MRTYIVTGMIGLFVVLLLSSCGISYRNAEVNRFMGQNESMLYKQYGNPWSVTYDSKGQKVLTFEVRFQEDVQTEGTSWTDSSGVTHHNPPTTRKEWRVEHRIFTVDKDGQVVKVSWKMF